MRESLSENLEKLKSQARHLLERFEESALFERLWNSYHNASPLSQRRLKIGSAIVGIGLVGFVLILPIVHAVTARATLREYRSLIADMRSIGSSDPLRVLAEGRPQGFANLPATDLEELEISIEQFMANIGVPAEFYRLDRQSSQNFDLNLEELSIRQLRALLFQMDAWYPQIGFESVDVSVHPESKEMLALKGRIYFGQPVSGADFSREQRRHTETSGNGDMGGTRPRPGDRVVLPDSEPIRRAEPRPGRDGGLDRFGSPEHDSPTDRPSGVPRPDPSTPSDPSGDFHFDNDLEPAPLPLPYDDVYDEDFYYDELPPPGFFDED